MSFSSLIRRYMLVAVLLVGSSASWAANILLYDANTVNDRPQTALANLGLAYTVGGSANFNTLLTGGSWDLVILDIPSTPPSGGFGDLINYISGGGRAILSFWDLDLFPALATAFGASVASSFDSPQDVYSWDAAHPVWAGVSTLTGWSDIWADDGDRLNPVGSAVALGGFVTTAGTANEAAIILGNGGRTIVNGFLFDEITDANGVKLIENEVSFLLNSVPEPGTLALLGLGLAGLAATRRRKQ